jgi:hypothetical protein|tara:strand:+ start:467 stop:649 length:183 start_codon:yes stop_codon:yes gene_type:complete
MTNNNEKGNQMSDIEKYELHLELCQIANHGYFISFDEWKELVKNTEEDWREFWAEVRANA